MRKQSIILCLLCISVILCPLSIALSQESGDFIEHISLQARIGYMDITQASDSFKAVFNRSAGISFGGGVKIDFNWGIFFEASFDYCRRNGQRVFVSGNEVVKTDLDTNAVLAPFSFSGGYQFFRDKKVSPYVAGGFSFFYFKEKEYIAWDEKTSFWHTGYHLLGGVEFLKRDKISLSAEGKWSHVPDVIGHHGVSAYYEEDNIGGLSIIFKINFHLK